MSSRRLQKLRCILWNICKSSRTIIRSLVRESHDSSTFVILLTLASCGSEQEVFNLKDVSTDIKVSTRIDLSEVSDNVDFAFSAINQNSERIDLSELNFNAETGFLSFRSTADSFTDVRDRYFADSLLAMGQYDQIAFSEIDTNSGFVEKPLGILRLDVRPVDTSAGLSVGPYTQFSIVLTRRAFFSDLQDFSVVGQVRPVETGINRVKVIDEDNQPVAEAKVFSFLHGKFSGSELPIWASPGFRPVIERTDKDGLADIMPLVNQGAYQTIVRAEGFCDFVTGKKTQNSENNLRETITLRKCQTSENEFDFVASWDSGLIKFKEKLPLSDESGEVVYTNQGELKIRLDNRGTEFRPVRVSVSEIAPSSKEECVIEGYPEVNEFFTSEITLQLPQLFYADVCQSESRSQSGIAVVDVELLSSLSESPEIVSSTRLYLKKSTSTPSIVDASELTVESSVGVPFVISGRPDTEFSINRPLNCPDERSSLGIRIDGQKDIVFKECKDDPIFFTAEELGFPTLFDTNQDAISFDFFVKDIFGNISPEDENKLNRSAAIKLRRVLPEFASLKEELGITLFFGEDGVGATNEIIRDNISDYYLAFSMAIDCSNSIDDVYKFTINKSESLAMGADNLSLCQKDGEAVRLALDGNSIFFPEDPADNALFFMVILDSAGHLSDPIEFSIPPCPSEDGSSLLCWSPSA